MVNNLFGLFFAIFHINIVFGNIISSTVIGDGFPSFSDVGNFLFHFHADTQKDTFRECKSVRDSIIASKVWIEPSK